MRSAVCLPFDEPTLPIKFDTVVAGPKCSQQHLYLQTFGEVLTSSVPGRTLHVLVESLGLGLTEAYRKNKFCFQVRHTRLR